MQSGISPTVAMWMNVLFLVLTGIAAGTVIFPSTMSVEDVNLIKSIATDGAFVITAINIVFHAFSSSAAGPVTKMLRGY